jgi:glycosyltransferase involved in cell wall biosynthesis
MRIGFISTMAGDPWGGSEELWAATAFKAIQGGHEVVISVFGRTNEAPRLGELERRGAKILRRQLAFGTERSPSSATSNYRDLFKTDPDVIVISQGSSFDVVLYKDLLELLYVSPIPYVLICHFNEDLPLMTNHYRRQNACKIFSRAFRVLFVSNRNRIEAERQLAKKIPNSGLVLNPVNLSDRSYVPWPESRTGRLASVARLDSKYKGQDILIEALSADEWRERDWHLTFYGAGYDEEYLRALVEFFELTEQVTFAGYHSDVRAIWAQEQILVLSSRAEGTPLSLVEAMLCGRPAIVSGVGGNQEWVTEPHSGFVAEAPVTGLVRAALDRAWSARGNWSAMGREAHKVATAKLSDTSIPGLLDVLSEASALKRAAGAATGEALERLEQYWRLVDPPLVKRIAQAGEARAKKILKGLQTAHIALQERCLQRFERARVDDPSQLEERDGSNPNQVTN